jgi:prepilin-type N-terminal cleavage/methylation domain-containing protein
MRPTRSSEREAGFTLLEMLVVVLIIGIMATLGMPALQQMISRTRLEGLAREVGVICQSSRLEAIKGGIPTVIRFDHANRIVLSWVDANGDNIQDPDERELMRRPLPGQVEFDGPDSLPETEGLPKDADGAWLTFNVNGSIGLNDPATATGECGSGLGCVRLADFRNNYLELRIGPAATAKVEIRKWNGSDWVLPGEGGHPWQWN